MKVVDKKKFIDQLVLVCNGEEKYFSVETLPEDIEMRMFAARLKTFLFENPTLRLNLDVELVGLMLDAFEKVKEKYGDFYCPCFPNAGKQKDSSLICPCERCVEAVKENGQCHCGMFVRA